MQSLYKGNAEFKFNVTELSEKLFHCNALKDMSAISFEDSKTLQKNSVILNNILQPLNDNGQLLTDKRNDLNERSIKEGETDALKKERDQLKKDVAAHNHQQHAVFLFTIPETNFPTDKEKYGTKKINNNGQPVEWARFESFLELLGNVIEEKK